MKTVVNHSVGKWFFSFAALVCVAGLGFFVSQPSFDLILLFYLPFFLIYWIINLEVLPSNVNYFLGLAIALRLVLLFSMPQLSDDVYRFIWDGRLLLQGINPFLALPSEIVGQGTAIPGIDKELFALLNSPEYYTIYPPVCQGSFLVSVWLFPESLQGSAMVMKAFLFLCELGSLYLIVRLLAKFGLPRERVLWYALNPLIIVEICGNLHYEGAMVFFLLLAVFLLFEARIGWAALALSLSIGSKLLPLMFLPFLFRRLGWKKSIRFFLVLGLCLLALFLPLFSGAFLQNFGDSVDLYFRKFEFNASIYYLFRWIGFQWQGYNMIAYSGPILALLVLLSILLMAWRDQSDRIRTLPRQWLAAISLYLLLATTVHPWYLSLPLVLCVFTRFRFPVFWSFLIMLTYVNYSYIPYEENLWVVAVEYVSVIVFLFLEGSGKIPTGWKLLKKR